MVFWVPALWYFVDGDRLVYRSWPDALPLSDETRALIGEHRSELLAWLRTPAVDLPDEDLEELDFDPGAFKPATRRTQTLAPSSQP